MRYVFLLLAFISTTLTSYAGCGCGEAGFSAKNEKVAVDKIAIRGFKIETEEIKESIADEVIRTTGQIEEIPNNHFDVNSPVQGRVISVLATLGDKIRAGQPLATIQSTDIAKLQAEINQLKADLKLAESSYEREKVLYEKTISPKKDFEAAEAVLLGQKAKYEAAESNLQILTQQVVSQGGTFTIKSLKSGTIVERNITVGKVVVPDELLFHGIDLSTVWASADVYEKDLSKVMLGQNVTITLDGVPDKIFNGKLTYVGSVLNKDTRTLPVKATLLNPDELIKPGSFLQLAISTGKKQNSIVIPKTALVEADKDEMEKEHKHIVYLKNKDKFVPRKIEVAPHDSNNVIVLSGLSVGEVLVTNGAYQLQFGEGEHEHEHNDKEEVAGHKEKKEDGCKDEGCKGKCEVDALQNNFASYGKILLGILALIIVFFIGRKSALR